MTGRTRRIWWSVVALALACGATVAVAQTSTERGDGSLSALTGELRQLRQAVESLAKTQAQTQALGVYLSVQQTRIAQVATRLDAAQKDLDSARGRSNEIADQLTRLRDELSNAAGQERNALEDAVRGLSFEQKGIASKVQQARTRETELYQALQAEEARWSELISRLEQLIRN